MDPLGPEVSSDVEQQLAMSRVEDLEAELAAARDENAQLRSQLQAHDTSAVSLLAQAQEVSDNLIEEALHRVQRIIKAAQSRPPYDNIGEIVQLSRSARGQLQTSADQLHSAISSLDALIAAIERPQVFHEPKPDPLNDRHWLPVARRSPH